MSIAQKKAYESPERHRIQQEAARRGNLTRLKTTAFISDYYYRVKCIETNETFSSIREAARKLGVNRGVITRAVKEGMPYNGMNFKLISKEEYAKAKGAI